MHSDGAHLETTLDRRLVVAPLSIDDYACIRYLHTTSLAAASGTVLSDQELSAFNAHVATTDYVDALLEEETVGAWFDDELVGTASWQPGGSDVARVGCVFVRHPGFGIGRRLLAAVEARAQSLGFLRFAAATTANAVPFFERLGYTAASRGTKKLSAHCILPVTFLRKTLAPMARAVG